MYKIISNFIQQLHSQDAGLIRLKKATRTAAAGACSLLFLGAIREWTPLISSIIPLSLGGVITMQLMLMTNGQTRKQQKICMLSSGVIIIAEILFLHQTTTHPFIQNVILCILAFFCFYVRRYGLHFVGIGLASLFSYIVLSFLIPPTQPVLPLLSATIAAIVISYVVNFYFLPNDPEHAYRDAIRQYIRCAAQTADRLALLVKGNAPVDPHTDLLSPLQQAFETADNISTFLPIDDDRELGMLESILYRLNGSFVMLVESMQEALQLKAPITPQIQNSIIDTLFLLRNILNNETIVPATPTNDAKQLTEQLYNHVTMLRNELLTNTDLLSSRFFYLARVTFCFRRLDTTLRDLQKNRRQLFYYSNGDVT